MKRVLEVLDVTAALNYSRIYDMEEELDFSMVELGSNHSENRL
jgi:hypothetical protein